MRRRKPTKAEAERALEALREWFKFQSMENTGSLYNAASAIWGDGSFDPTEYDDVE